MKLCRFNEKGIAAVRELLPQIKVVDDLARAEALVSAADLIEPIPALADIDLDASRIFPTTFAFCEYFHSLMKDHKPLAYRTDVGFWTWLAMVYVRQLVKVDDKSVKCGDEARLVLSLNYGKSHRHLFACPFYLYVEYEKDIDCALVAFCHPINMPGDVFEQIVSHMDLMRNPAMIKAATYLYYDPGKKALKPRSGHDGPGRMRRFVSVVDQLAETRDFYLFSDVDELIRVLPEEFNEFK